MKTVIISRNDKELTRVPLNRKSITAGRSPSCDAVVRYRGVKPVQFLIEHVSENLRDGNAASDFETGFWTLIDVSENELHAAGARAQSSAGGGAGIVIDTTQQNFNGFDFKVVTDTLQETDLKKGVLSRSLERSGASAAATGEAEARARGESFSADGGRDRNVVEVVYFRKDIDIVTNISHLNRRNTSKKIRLFPQQLPDFVFEWNNDPEIKATLRSENPSKDIEIFCRGERITADFLETKSVAIHSDDMIHIATDSDDFYLRLVPEIKVGLEKFSWVKDYMVRTSLVVIALVCTLVFLVKNFSPELEVKVEPPRLIQIETVPPPDVVLTPPEPPPAPPEPPEPGPTIEKPAEPVVQVQPVPKPAETPQSRTAPKKTPDIAIAKKATPETSRAAKAAVVQKPTENPRVGLNNNSKTANVNTIGLLAKLKNGQKETTQKVSADQVLNQGIVSETMTGNAGAVVVNKAPQGTIGRQPGPVNKNALAQASTTLSGATSAHSKAIGAMAMDDGKDRFSSGAQIKGLQGSGGMGTGSSAAGGVGVGGSGFDRGEAMSAVGGLDKDTIRKALGENRRAIANCYESALLTKRQLDGRMTFRWVISIEGSVSAIKLQTSEIGMPNFESCVENVIRGINFPLAPNKLTTTVIYPFVFQGKK